MSPRAFAAAGALAAMVVLASLPIAAQSTRGWKAPRTPWGEPDLQGTYTNTYENGTPLERPEQFAGRALDDIKGEELATLRRDIQRRTIANFEGYGNSYGIVQGPGLVAITYEMIHETRVIPLDGRPHVPSGIRMHMGDARGRWEGDTLVVETTNFRDESAYRGSNASTLRLTERFTRVGPDKLRWAVTVEDPTTWTRPWTFAMPLTVDDGQPVPAYECHEGNLGLRNILSGARADEKRK